MNLHEFEEYNQKKLNHNRLEITYSFVIGKKQVKIERR